jgi:hypothetical protein
MMQEGFDPYRKWLGIPPRDQPPHHYRLLGVEPFETDPDVIANAADARMAQVKNFQGGKHSAASQRILNELAAAKVCLLNPEKKAAYDRLLRQQVAAKTAPPAAAKTPPTPAPLADDRAACFLTSVTGGAAGRADARGVKPRKKSPWPLAVAVGAAGVFLVLLAILLLQSNQGPSTPATGEPKPQPDRSVASNVAPSSPTKPVPQEPSAPETEKTTAGAAAKAGAARQPSPREAEPPPPLVQVSQAQAAEAPAGQPPATAPDEAATNALQGAAPPSAPAAAPGLAAVAAEDKKLPVPDAADQEAVEKRIRHIFQQEFSGSRTAAGKVKLAEKLFEQGVATTDDPTARFVLWRLAAETAAEGGELAKSLEITDKLDEVYRVDGLAMKADLVGTAVKSSRTGPVDADAGRQLVDTILSLADAAAARDEFELAGRLVKSAAVVGRRLKDLQLSRDLAARGHELERLKGKFAAVEKALDTLAADPADGEANATAGQWYCFVKENWPKGLPLLAKGNGAELAKLAQRDLAQGTDAKEQVMLADAWSAWAAKEPVPARSAVQARAAHWYQAALPKLTGLDKAGVQQKLKAMAQETAAGNRRGKEPKNAVVPRPEIDVVFEKQGVVDRAGRTHPTVVGRLRYVAGPGGAVAAHFSDARVDLGKCNMGASPFTLEIGLRPERNSRGFQQFAGWHQSGGDGALFFGRDGEQLHLHYAGAAGRVRKTYPLTIEPERWHHLAFVREAGEVLFYLDGRQAFAAPPMAADLPTQAYALAIGNEGSRAAAFSGDVLFVRLYRSALTARQIQARAASSLGQKK